VVFANMILVWLTEQPRAVATRPCAPHLARVFHLRSATASHSRRYWTRWNRRFRQGRPDVPDIVLLVETDWGLEWSLWLRTNSRDPESGLDTTL